MPIIIKRNQLVAVRQEFLEERSWWYYQCQECGEDYKSDIPFKRLWCIDCGKVMHRNCHQVEAW